MKKLIVITLSVLIFCQCKEENEILDQVSDQESAIVKFTSLDQSPLEEHSGFMNFYNNTIGNLKRSVPTTDLKGLQNSGGELYFRSEDDFRSAYEMIESADENWNNSYEIAIDNLREYVLNNADLKKSFGNEEEIDNELEDLLEKDQISDVSLQEAIARKLPFNPLWAKVKSLEDQWLANSGDELDFSKDPTNDYLDDPIMQLLLNESSRLNVAGVSSKYVDEVINHKSSGRSTRNSGQCVKHKRVVKYGNNGDKSLKVSIAIRNYGFVKWTVAKVTGYKKRRRRWKKRRFHKELQMVGNMILHHDTQGTICNPDRLVVQNKRKSSSRKKFNIKVTKWNNWIMRLCDDQFDAIGTVDGLTVVAPI